MRRACPAIPVLILFLSVLAPGSLEAQQNGVARPMAFAELTYGEAINAMVPDGAGGVWFGGYTCSTALPTTSNAIQRTWPGQPCLSAGLLGRMKGDGTVVYLSYFGGSGVSQITALAVAPSGNLYVAGTTASGDMPTTTGAYDRNCNNCAPDANDGFVAELTADGSQIVFSTYLGGSGNDAITAIAIDASGRVHVAGGTGSADFPVTPGALQTTFAGGQNSLPRDGFYARFSADGTALQYSTYLGGSGYDQANGIAVDAGGDAYVVGGTFSTTFPAIVPGNPNAPTNGNGTGFLARFASSGPVYVTYVGAPPGTAVAVSVVGDRAYIAGQAGGFGFAYVAEVATASGAVTRSIDFHGAAASGSVARALAVDQNRLAYLAGGFQGNDCISCGPEATRYPATWDAYKRSLSGGDEDAVLSIVDFGSATPTVRYSTMLGGALRDEAYAVAPDGTGGAFIAGLTLSYGAFDSINAQPQPRVDDGADMQSFVARAAVRPVTMPTPPADIVLYAADLNGISPAAIGGDWKIEGDTTAAGGWMVHEPDGGAAKITTPAASPANAFELEFQAQANVPYHLWLRMKADNNSYLNDSVWVQFSDSVDAAGNPIWRIRSTDGTAVTLEDCGGCGEQGWGWNDNGYGVAGTPVMFATSGWHTIRIQQREDGVAIDQIVLSSGQWANTPPGANKNDTTVLPQTSEVAANQPPVVTIETPSNGATFTAPADITVSGTASDSDGSISKVDIYINGQLGMSGGPASFLTTWYRVPAGTYTFVAIATDNQGASTSSSPVTVTVTGSTSGTLPSGWTDADVGATGAAGNATYGGGTAENGQYGGTFTVQGAGADVWGTADAFNFAYVPLPTNGWIKARVATVSSEAAWVKAGVMIRSSLSPSSAQAFMLVSHGKGVAFQRRTADGATSTSTSGSASTAPRWVMIVRQGTVIYGYESPDNVNWKLVGSDIFTMPDTVLMGLAVSSHVSGTLATATFDNVTTRALPNNWADVDIGSVPFPGNANWNGGTFTVTGSGADIWGTADAFTYTYHMLDGDGTIVARVTGVDNVAAWVKAGVMIRDSFDPGSAQAFVLVSSAKGVAFQRRRALGGTSVSTAGSASTAPHWVKLTRSGDTFTAYESSDGTTWTQIGSDSIPMGQTLFIGLAVTSHSTSASATCTFDNVTITAPGA